MKTRVVTSNNTDFPERNTYQRGDIFINTNEDSNNLYILSSGSSVEKREVIFVGIGHGNKWTKPFELHEENWSEIPAKAIPEGFIKVNEIEITVKG